MTNQTTQSNGSGMEVSLKKLLDQVVRYKFLIIGSVLACLAIAFIYLKTATPIYEIGTSLLIDPSGTSRQLGESKYLEGGVSAIEPEKNLFNEVGILKSYGLIERTVKELKFDVTYHTRDRFKEQEHFGAFPVVVKPDYDKPQLYDTPFEISLLSDSTYQVSVEAETFTVFNPATGSKTDFDYPIKFSTAYRFGEPLSHEYFHFTVEKPDEEEAVLEGMFEDQELFFQLHSIEDVANAYLSKLEVNQKDIEGSILDLRSQGAVPAKEITFLNLLTKKYIHSQLSERDQIAINKEEFIRKQLAEATDSLSAAERDLEIFRRSTRAVDLSQTATNALTQVSDLSTQQAQIETNIKYYQTQLNNLQDSSAIDQIIAPSVVGINDPLLNENLLELKRLYSEKTRVEFIKGKQSLDLELLDQQIQNSTSSLQQNLRSLIGSSRISLQGIGSRMDNQERIINVLPSNERELLKYQRKSTLYENLFNYLSQELAKTGIAKAEDISDTKVLDEARILGSGPIAPQKKMILALAFILGLLLPMGWILLYDSIDETIHDLAAVETYANLPVAASIASDNSNSLLSVTKLSEWRVEESFRDLTASVQFLIADPEKNVIGITSTVSGEGKSFCSINLAVHFAKAGKRILLIDSDFRKPSLIEMPQTGKKKKDFADYLNNSRIVAKTIIQKHPDVENFHYITNREEVQNPQRLLSNPRYGELLEEVRKDYDYVIIDSPAIGLVSDYLLLSQFIDIHLFLIRRKVSKISYLKNLRKLNRNGKLKNIYLVFNGAAGKSFKYGYSSYDYSGRKSSARSRFGLKSLKNWLF